MMMTFEYWSGLLPFLALIIWAPLYIWIIGIEIQVHQKRHKDYLELHERLKAKGVRIYRSPP